MYLVGHEIKDQTMEITVEVQNVNNERTMCITHAKDVNVYSDSEVCIYYRVDGTNMFSKLLRWN